MPSREILAAARPRWDLKMKKIALFCLSWLVLTHSCVTGQSSEFAFYVSPSGSDAWSGKLDQPNPAASDGPFLTLQRARQAVRDFTRLQKLPHSGLTVWIRGGTYPFSESFVLGKEDSGQEGRLVRWRAFPGEVVRLVGGKQISGFKPVTDPPILARLSSSARDHVMQVDLRDQGIRDFGELKTVGMGLPLQPAPLELFFNGRAMTLARYPNTGWLNIVDVPQSGEKLFHKGVTHTPKDGIPRGRHYGRFTYPGERPSRWGALQEIWMRGYWTWDWADAQIRAARIDTSSHTIYPVEPHYKYGYTKEQRFYFLNILEELDMPGEYYLDRSTGILYFWPPQAIASGDVFVSLLDQSMLVLDDASYLSIEGMIFEGSRGNGIVINGGRHNRIAGCTIRNVGNVGVIVQGGNDNGVLSCDIYDTGDGGIRLDGGDRMTLSPGRHYATNNHIYRFSRINLTYRHAVQIRGVGNIASHNRIHDAPHEAIYFGGNEHSIEYNEIFNIVQETGDAGAIHTGRNYTWRGNKIRFNYFHDLHGPGLFGVMGVYLDDFMSGTTVYGNIFYRAGRAMFIGGGRDNLVENNIFVDCEASVHIDARGTTWAKYYFDGTYNVLTDSMRAVNYDRPPYSERYPELLSYYDDEPAVPKNNRVFRNISMSQKWLDIEDGVDVDLLKMENNVIADSILCYWRGPDVKDALTGMVFTRTDTEFVARLTGNQLIEGDPGFSDAANGDFRLNQNSPALKLGFVPVPMDSIGLYLDEFRKQLPNR